MKPEFLYEISWEVCNKVGGIYAVLSSKAASMIAHYGENYVLIGPFFSMEKLVGEFEELAMPDLYRQVANALVSKNIRLHWGKWLIPGSPQVLLVDFVETLGQADEIKRQLWQQYQVDSWQTGDDVTHPFVWSWCVAHVLQAIADATKSKAIVGHFHEWLSGAGLLYLKSLNVPIQSVFTTHATVLGRALAESGVSIYEHIETIDAQKEAYRVGVATKHLAEKAAASEASVASTVSNITASEVKHFLGREVEGILPNGLDISKYPTIEEVALRHRAERDRMREFILYYFLPYYDLDVENSLFYFISGRYEVKNKGLDVFISALGKLNEMLKRDMQAKTVIAFLLVPSAVRGVQPEIIENREWFRDMQRSLQEVHDTFLDNVMYRTLVNKPLTLDTLFGADHAQAFETKKKKFHRKGKPPLCTYELADKNDAIMKLLQEANLTNEPSDKVKVIYYPTYLNGGDGLLNMEYQEVVLGSHFGIFPSLYEPWGYTPLETAALGVASLTSDLAGFGEFVRVLQEKEHVQSNNKGIFLLNRKGKSYDAIINDLSKIMHDYAGLSREDRVNNKLAAKMLAEHADWKELVNYYFALHERSLQK